MTVLLKAFLPSAFHVAGRKFAPRSDSPSSFKVSILVEPEMYLPFISIPAYRLMDLNGG